MFTKQSTKEDFSTLLDFFFDELSLSYAARSVVVQENLDKRELREYFLVVVETLMSKPSSSKVSR